MTTTSTLRDWVNHAWTERYGYPFNDWAADRIDRGVSSRQLSREVDDMTKGAAGLAPNTLLNWFPALRTDGNDQDTSDD